MFKRPFKIILLSCLILFSVSLLFGCLISFSNSNISDYSDLIITEVFYDSEGTDSGCFIEIYNTGSSLVDLNDASHDIIIEGMNGANGERYIGIDLIGTIAAGDY